MIVTIDGPAGSGKSSAAKALAKRLRFEFLDTGAMYRAVALAALRQNCDIHDANCVSDVAAGIDIEFKEGGVFLNGEDVTDAIRQPRVTEAAGALAVHPGVRDRLVTLQRQFAHNRDVVSEGRDQGSVVFPDAECKFYLIADEDERARRRHRELVAKNESVTLSEVRHAMKERDERDLRRKVAPLRQAADAKSIDTTHLTLDEVIDVLEHAVKQKLK